MLNSRLKVTEYLLVASSFVALIIAIASGQLIFAIILLFICLVLNLINRFYLEQQIKHRLTTVSNLQRRLEENEQQLQETRAFLQTKIPAASLSETSEQIHTNTIYTAQLTSLEQSIKSVVQYLNTASLPTRVERLEKVNLENVQLQHQLPEVWHHIKAIEQQLKVVPSPDLVAQANCENQTLEISTPQNQISPSLVVDNLSICPPTYHELHTLTGHSDWISSIAISPDSKTIASGSFDKTIKLWKLSTGQLIHTLSNHLKGVVCIAISPDGKTLASGGWDETINLWNLDTGKLIYALKGHTSSVRSLAISADSQTLISGSFDETIKLWCLKRGEFLGNLAQRDGQISAIALSSDGHTLASAGGDGTITLRKLETSRATTAMILTLKGNLSSVNSLAISSDCQILAAGCSDGNVKLWQLNGELLNSLQGHTAPVMSVVFSLNTPTLISGSADGTIRTWHLKTGKPLAVLPNHSTGSIMSVAISPDNHFLVGGSADNSIKIWQCN